MGTRKNNKKIRKTRSKRQRGGTQIVKDKSLFDAIGTHNLLLVEAALNNGADVNSKAWYYDDDHNEDKSITPLIHAINSGYGDMVSLLLNYPGINIGMNVDTNKELALAKELEEDDYHISQPHRSQLHRSQPRDIPTLIEDHIKMKRDFIRKKHNVTKELLNYKRQNIPSLQTMSYYQSPSALDTYINVNPGTMKRPHGKLGGKRKTRKKNSIGRKKCSKRQRGGTNNKKRLNTFY